MAYPEEIRNAARGLYLKRWTPQEIKDELGLNSCRVVYFWAERYGWRDLLTKPTFKGICHPINYSIESKSRLVLKMIDVVEANRIEWDSADRDIPLAFLAIKRSTTGGGQMTFRAARDNVTGHADVFFAIAHAVANEPLDTNPKRKSTWATSQERKAA